MWKACLAFVGVLSSAALVLGAPIDNPWPSIADPFPGPPRAIGDYSAGCLQGAEALPLDGPGYQVMRPSRRRYFGHPHLVDFVQKLGGKVRKEGLGVLLVGDLSQPRGGRASGGHSSHQTGLDVDVWFWRPKHALKAPLSMEMRESLPAPSILDTKASAIKKPWKSHVANVLRLAAEDPRVDRIFVNPSIKRELCETSTERDHLRKLRPWHGHDDHFHARLACPAGDTDCKPQARLPEGDGCDQLGFWFDREAQAAREKARAEYRKNIREGRRWPERCDALLPQDLVGQSAQHGG